MTVSNPATVVEALPRRPFAIPGVIPPPPADGTAGALDLAARWRWLTISTFVLFSSLNFLDRQLLAAVAPSVMSEFGLNNLAYGTLLAAFSLPYMLMAPLAGLFIDRVGLRAGAAIAVGSWSLVALVTGQVTSYAGLIACRMGLGVAEAPGIPCASKASATYLPPREQGFGIAVQSFGFTVGSMVAPLLVALIGVRYGWRSTFMVGGLAGLFVIPLLLLMTRRVPAAGAATGSDSADVRRVLTDRRFWVLLAANALIMTVHSMWMNWTTLYFVEVHGLSQSEANGYFAWIPPVFATIGGLFGAWLSLRACARGVPPLAARLRICGRMGPLLLLTAFVPLMPSPASAAAAISVSFFCCMAMLNNLHVVPIDLFGARRAAFTSAMIVSSYAMVQVVLSPAMGAVVDRFGFGILCVGVSGLPLVAVGLLRTFLPPQPIRTVDA
jgi:MFS transporter, ACS family, hexuronate transporter